MRSLVDFGQWPQWELGLGFISEERKGDYHAEEVFGGLKQRVVEAVIRGSRPIADVVREYGLGGLNPGGVGSRRIAERAPNQKTSYRCPNEND